MTRQVGDFLRPLIEPGETLVAAVSGGIDSMLLLEILNRLRPQLCIEIHVAHLDHQLRVEAAEDCEFVAVAAAQRGLSCTCGREDVVAYAQGEKLSLEDAARRLRYRFLDRVARDVGAKKIALGHHADDQAETVLLHLLRGSGTRGLSGMSAVRQGRYIRPFLNWSRADIKNCAHEADLNYREDASNRDPRFDRNRVRHQLLPLLQQSFNPAVVEALGRTATVLKEEDDLLGKMTQDAVETVVKEYCKGKITLDSRQLLDYHIAIQRRVVRQVLQGLSAREGPFDFARTETVLGLANERCSKVCEFADIRAQNVGEELIFCRGSRPTVDIAAQVPGRTCVPSHDCTVEARLIGKKDFVAVKAALGGRWVAFDARLAEHRLRLRSARPGDRFSPFGMSGHKKLSDFLIDCKWPRILRDEILLLTCADEIAWVVGLRPSQLFCVWEDTTEILLVEMRPTP